MVSVAVLQPIWLKCLTPANVNTLIRRVILWLGDNTALGLTCGIAENQQRRDPAVTPAVIMKFLNSAATAVAQRPVS